MAGIITNKDETSFADVDADDLIRIRDVTGGRHGWVQVQDLRNMADYGTVTATATAGAATLNKHYGKITSEALTTAAAAAYTLTLTNSTIAATDIVFASVANGTNTAGIPLVGAVKPAAGSVVIVIENQHATAAFNGTVVISFEVRKV